MMSFMAFLGKMKYLALALGFTRMGTCTQENYVVDMECSSLYMEQLTMATGTEMIKHVDKELSSIKVGKKLLKEDFPVTIFGIKVRLVIVI